MVHTFEIDNKHFLFDVESGSLFSVDKIVRDIVDSKNMNDNAYLLSYSTEEICDARKEIEELEKDGFLFATPCDISINTVSQEVKALCLHICHDCNLRCAYCFADEGAYCGEREFMSFEVGKNAIDFLIQNSGKRKNLEVDFFGGEPLMNFDVVKEIVSYAENQAKLKSKEFKFTLTTNAVLLNDDIIEYLNEKMDNVVISIDGRKEIHDAVRKTINGKGSFDVAVKNALKFRNVRGDKSYYIRGTFTALNPDFCKDVLLINDLGFDQISIEPVVLSNNHKLALKDCQLDEINSNYVQLAKEYVARRKTDKWFNFFHFFIDLENSPCLTKRLKGCGAGNEYMAVVPNGEIYPCHQFAGKKEFLVGNVFDKNINMDIKNKFAKSSLLTKPDCKDCFAKYHCSGGCAANNINFSGDINKPFKQSCEMMKKRLECSLYVYAEEHLK